MRFLYFLRSLNVSIICLNDLFKYDLKGNLISKHHLIPKHYLKNFGGPRISKVLRRHINKKNFILKNNKRKNIK